MPRYILCRLLLLTATAFLLLEARVLAEAKLSHPIVPAFERFYTVEKADTARGGQLLLGELNCVSCHHSNDTALLKKQAPLLDDVGTRVRVSYLKKYLNDPQAVRPGGTMPALFVGDPDKAQKIEALVHFLAATGTLKQERPDAKGIGLGRDLYHKVGCAVCHGPRDAVGKTTKLLPTTVRLGDLQEKYSVTSLTAFLDNPQRVRPSGRMPHLVSGKEAKDIASYLLQGIKIDFAVTKGSTQYAYFEGTWDKVPDFDKLKPKTSGVGSAFDLGLAKRANDYALKFEGFFKAERDGTYTFALHSDDGSKLHIDGQQVATNDGIHPPQTTTGKVKLTKGIHKVVVGFFQGGGGAELDVQVSGPGLPQQPLSSLVGSTEAILTKPVTPPKQEKDEDYLEIQPDLVAKGKLLFASSGCASCHTMKNGNKPLVSTLKAPILGQLKPEGGCLSANPAPSLPHYGLSPAQTAALTAVLKNPPPPSKEPAAVIARVMTTFNCYACHSRDKIGGPEEEWNKLFLTTEPEMGDEARVPPPLDLVGAKINPDYLKQILDKGSHDRPYMHTRMPGFGLANVGSILPALAALDKLEAIPPLQIAEPPAKVKAGARYLIGGQALGCIKCHTFAGHKAEGTQGIDMTLMTKRLQRDWFFAYLVEPQKIRPGTRMPTAWPNGKSVLPEVLDGKGSTQIEAIWVYLNDGKSAQLPIGLQKNSIPLLPGKEAIIYRNFIQGSGPRAIGVGYPEHANLTFDANEMRLSLLWHGAFIDAARHWTQRGQGYEPPLGDNILPLPSGASFAVLEKTDTAWPTTSPRELGYKFLGYHLTPDERPTFFYSFNGIKVEDFPNPVVAKEVSIKRLLKLSTEKPVDSLFFRAAVGTKIEALENGWFRIDGWKMKLEGGGTPRIRQADGKKELLVPVRFTDNKAQIVQEYAW